MKEGYYNIYLFTGSTMQIIIFSLIIFYVTPCATIFYFTSEKKTSDCFSCCSHTLLTICLLFKMYLSYLFIILYLLCYIYIELSLFNYSRYNVYKFTIQFFYSIYCSLCLNEWRSCIVEEQENTFDLCLVYGTM